MEAFPAIFPLAGLRVAVVGDGAAAEAKARLFDGSPATLLRAPAAAATAPGSYAGARLAFIAMATPEAAAVVARQAGALVNVVDRPELCDFTTPAIVDRGAVVGAITTGGKGPALVAELRQGLEVAWPEGLGRLADLLERIKGQARAAAPDPADRRTRLRALLRGPAAQAALEGDMARAEALAGEALAGAAPLRRLWRARAPAAPDLITLRLLRVLSEADVVVADTGVDPQVLAYARRDAVLQALQPGEVWRLPAQATVAVRLYPGEAPQEPWPDGWAVSDLHEDRS
jgi:precorrin-2 dehydrogenase / sirohydrochlorin ferrochelatase